MDRQGRVVLITGDGKGKTCSALGMSLRAAGHGMRVLFLQFMKHDASTGEIAALARIPEIDIIQEFLPQALSEEEVDAIVTQAIEQTGASSIKDMGKVMGLVKPQIIGRADMGEVSGRIKSTLSSN